SQSVAQRIALIAAQTIAKRGSFSIALAGGETPRHCYELLSTLKINWQLVHIYFCDERCLPRAHPQRNDSMTQAALLRRIDIPVGNVNFIPAEHGPQIAAAEYAVTVQQNLPLDLILLGMGEDGHTASLFPDNPSIELDTVTVPVFNAPKPPAERVSLGLSTMNAAGSKIFLVSGKTKQEALRHILRGEKLPAARITGAEWHVDCAALPDEISTAK
ncbi:MAG: 6-phosphogluconolactonase, partial [Gallionella sp.]|nr:6-phosphogluconolactonase [Gallionella sp.]